MLTAVQATSSIVGYLNLTTNDELFSRGYELILKQESGKPLSKEEKTIVTLVNETVDNQIQYLLTQITL